MNKILLIDGNSLFFKSFYATYTQLKQNASGTRGKDNQAVNALRTFGYLIVNAKKKFKVNKILVAFDERGSKTYRHIEYPEYKAHRPKQPDELYSQIPLVKEFLDLYGIKWFSNINFEADDIIGIVAEKFKKDHEIDIITTDKDLLQLVDKNVKVHLSKSGVSIMEEYNYNNFQEKFFNLLPFQIPDFKGIMGDASDNLKGIKGVGEKTALKLLIEHTNLENILENIDCLSSQLQKKILDGKTDGKICKSVATIMRNGELLLSLNDLLIKPAKQQELINFLEMNNIYNLIGKIF